ncbi:MAG TPA: DUF2795 domain-containing protein [Segeticoccus sp.]|nr:DUF2795 domain-containing protein [Segeticoccus sp.]
MTTTPQTRRPSTLADALSTPARADVLRPYLGSEHVFPADREDLLERGISRHAPPAVLEAILALPPGRSWSHPDAVLHELGLVARHGKPPRLSQRAS